MRLTLEVEFYLRTVRVLNTLLTRVESGLTSVIVTVHVLEPAFTINKVCVIETKFIEAEYVILIILFIF